eukprot:GFUD01013784.1.p1 GENE.GFUD01013784.1~~GFUD01013784.1.p1  ORF type:complete len:406 (-),score=126.38 GFUD01013784.1:67-1284(-)
MEVSCDMRAKTQDERSMVLMKQKLTSEYLRHLAETGHSSHQVQLPAGSNWRVQEPGAGQAGCVEGAAGGSGVELETVTAYRDQMVGQDHQNYQGRDPALGLVIISVQNTKLGEGQTLVHLIIRLERGTLHESFQPEDDIELEDSESVLNLAKIVCPDLTVDKVDLITSPEAEKIIAEFDDKICANQLKKNYKFGVLYQREGQVEESEIFGNVGHNEQFEQFISTLGEKVSTDSGMDFVSSSFLDYNFKFHVSTLLPHSASDPQQCDRKARIGNDVVCIVFQSGPATFSPEIITSQFLHVYIVLQPVGSDCYKVSVVSKSGVPEFGPNFPREEIFQISEDFKNKLFAKLINAEQASSKTGKLAQLNLRLRQSMLNQLDEKLKQDMNRSVQSKKLDDGWRPWFCHVL